MEPRFAQDEGSVTRREQENQAAEFPIAESAWPRGVGAFGCAVRIRPRYEQSAGVLMIGSAGGKSSPTTPGKAGDRRYFRHPHASYMP